MAKSVENAILAFVCWMSIDRSAGKFRIALITVSSYLTLLSVAQALIEYWRETNLIRNADIQIQFYADYLSLGLIIFSIIGCAFALQIIHWHNKVNREQAFAERCQSIPPGWPLSRRKQPENDQS